VNVKDLKIWVTSFIALYYFESACKPTETIHEWCKKIKEHCEVSNEILKTYARNEYKNRVAVLTSLPKDFYAWLNNWEETVTYAQAKKVPEALSVLSWFKDFL
jgi:hypothetical protein